MGKVSAVGLISLVSGLFMLIFKAIGSATSVSMTFPDLTIEKVIDPDKLVWIDELSISFLQSMADTLVTTPLYVGCIILGGVVLVIGGFLGK